MTGETLQLICNCIILLGSAAVAISHIADLIGKPIKFFEGKRSKQFREIEKRLGEISKQNDKQSELIGLINKSSLDLLRQNILTLYNEHKKDKQLTQTEKEYLDELFRDYTEQNGNSYIKKKYIRMQSWTIISDPDE